MSVDGQQKDLSYNIEKDSAVKIFTSKDQEGVETIRHDTAHTCYGCARAIPWNTSNYRTSYREWLLLRFC